MQLVGFTLLLRFLCEVPPVLTSAVDRACILVRHKLRQCVGAVCGAGRQLLEMPAEGFQPARIEVFGLAGLSAVGSMQQLELVHAGSLPWAVRYVKVHNETNGEKAIFVPDRCACIPLCCPLAAVSPACALLGCSIRVACCVAVYRRKWCWYSSRLTCGLLESRFVD